MNCIIAGSRGIDKSLTYEGIEKCLFAPQITVVLSGMCPDSPDMWGVEWAVENDLAWREYYANWNNLKELPCKIKYNKYGKPYNALAGFNRNSRMVAVAQALIVIWDGKSSGSQDVLDKAIAANLQYFVYPPLR